MMRYKELIVRRLETAKNAAELLKRGVENKGMTAQDIVEKTERLLVEVEAALELVEKED